MDYIIIDNEIFKQIRFNKRYYISKTGKVYSTHTKGLMHLMKRGSQNKLYEYIDIYVDGKQKHFPIHRLVYDTWVRPINSHDLILHKDDNQLNNDLSNLYIGTQKENIRDCISNKHRVGIVHYLKIYDKEKKNVLSFCPALDFIKYSGHSCQNGGLQRMFSRNWFKQRYQIIEYRLINNLSDLRDVKTRTDECKSVG